MRALIFAVYLLVTLSLSCTVTAMSAVSPLPALSDVAKNEGFENGASSLVNLWEHGLRLQSVQDDAAGESRSAPVVATILAPDAMLMVNLVPQDVSHPLYDDGPKYTALRHSFLLDYLIEQEVTPDNPAMATSQGLTVTNMNGNNIVFKKDANGALTVNGLSVSGQSTLSDGTRLYVLDGLLFNHKTDVKEAFKQLMAEQPRSGRCYHGRCHN